MSFVRDVAESARSLRKAPSFAVAAVLTFALGIGVNVAIYSVADALLVQPLPIKQTS